jgi:hypothetical protein
LTKAKLKGSTSLTSEGDPLKQDLRSFLFVVWRHLGLPDPTPIQNDIARFLHHGPKRLITEAFRGVGKSWATVAFVLWLLYCDRQHKVLVVSANATKANEFSTFSLLLINEMPLLAHLRARTDQRTSMTAFDVGPAKPDITPSVKSGGITGQLTGSRSNTIVACRPARNRHPGSAYKRDPFARQGCPLAGRQARRAGGGRQPLHRAARQG